MKYSVLNGDIMVQKGIFWTIGKHLYFGYYSITSYQKIKVYRVEKWIYEYSAGKMVSMENATLVSTVVSIVWDNILY